MNPKRKIIITSLICGIILLFLIFFGISSLLFSIRNRSAKMVKESQELALLEEKAKNFDKAQRSLKDLEPIMAKIEGLFIGPDLPVDLIRFWERTAAEFGIKLKNVSPANLKARENELWPITSFQITLEGSFPKFMKFLEKIENGPYLVEIQNIASQTITETAFEPKPSASAASDVNVSLMVKVYTK